MIYVNDGRTIITTIADLIDKNRPVEIWNIMGCGLEETQDQFERCNQWLHIDKDGIHQELKIRTGVIDELRVTYGTAK